MLDFNRHFYDEICGNNPSRNTRFDFKPGKDECYWIGPEIPQTFRFEDSNADEKRSCSCQQKIATPLPSH